MSTEELQAVIDNLGAVIKQFANTIGQIDRGIPKANTQSSIITLDDKTKNIERADKNARQSSDQLAPNEKRIEKERAKIFANEFKELFNSFSLLNNSNADVAEVSKGDVVELFDVRLVGINREVLADLKGLVQIKSNNPEKEGGGILGWLAGAAGAAAGAGAIGIISLLRMLANPQVVAGIAVALGTILASTVVLAASVAIVIKTLSYLKDDIIGLMPVFRDFVDIVVDAIVRILPPVFDGIIKYLKVIYGTAVDIIKAIVPIITTVIDAVKEVYLAVIDTIKTIAQLTSDTLKIVFDTFRDVFIETLNFIERTIQRIPDMIKDVLDTIDKFSNSVKVGAVGLVAAEIAALAISLGALTASSLINGLADFFFESPFEKIINFQNALDPSKFIALQTLAPSLEKMTHLDADKLDDFNESLQDTPAAINKLTASLKTFKNEEFLLMFRTFGVGETIFDRILDFQTKFDATKFEQVATIGAAFKDIYNLHGFMDKLVSKSQQVAATIESLYAGKSGMFNSTPGLQKIAEDMKTATSNIVTETTNPSLEKVITRVGDMQIRMIEIHINESKTSNRILSDILQKIGSMNTSPSSIASSLVDPSFPIQFNSIDLKRQLTDAGYK